MTRHQLSSVLPPALALLFLLAATTVAQDAATEKTEAPSVMLRAKDVPLSNVLQELSEKTGNACPGIDDKLKDTRITVAVDDATWWQALDAVCRSGKLIFDEDRATHRTVLRAAPSTGDTGTESGPVAIRMTSSMVHWWYWKGSPDVSCDFDYFWEDRLSVWKAGASITSALSPRGDVLEPPVRVPTVDQGYLTGTPGGHVGRFSLRIEEAPRGLDRLDEIKGVVRLTLGTGERTLRIDDVRVGNASTTAGGLTLTVRRLVDDVGCLALTVAATQHEEPGELPMAPHDGRYGFFLVDRSGKRFRGVVLPGSVRPRDHMLEAMRNGTFSMSYSGPRTPGSYGVCFPDVPADAKDLTLVYVYPEKTETKEYPFTIRDVPLP